MFTPQDTDRQEYSNVWVVGEQRGGQVKSVTYELLGAARSLASQRNCQVWCVLMGDKISESAGDCFARQADVVLAVDAPQLATFADDVYANVLCRLIRKYKPETVLCGATAIGRALIPRVAVQVNAGLTADCTGLQIEPLSGNLLQTRPAFGGNVIATIKSANHRPQMATVRPRVMQEPSPQPGRKGRLLVEPFLPDEQSNRLRILQSVTDQTQSVKLADAHFIITGGRGVKGPKGFKLLEEFASLVGGSVGASRAAVDAGWADYGRQIGQTGQTVQPRVYFACGVSGQIQHLVGMQSAEVIVAINTDSEAPMMKLADYAVVGDLFQVIPAMIRELKRV